MALPEQYLLQQLRGMLRLVSARGFAEKLQHRICLVGHADVDAVFTLGHSHRALSEIKKPTGPGASGRTPAMSKNGLNDATLEGENWEDTAKPSGLGGGGVGLWFAAQDRPVHVGAQFLALDARKGLNVGAPLGRDLGLFPLVDHGVATKIERARHGGHAATGLDCALEGGLGFGFHGREHKLVFLSTQQKLAKQKNILLL